MTIDVRVERDNVNDEFVIIRKIHRRDGDTVALDEPILDMETSKTTVEIRSPAHGILSIAAREDDELAVGAALFQIKPLGEDRDQPRSGAPAPGAVPLAMPASESSGSKLSRAAQQLARDLAVDPRAIHSEGSWVTRSDVLALARPDERAAAAPAVILRSPAGPAAALQPPKVPHRPQRISSSKRTEARNIARANSSGNTSMIGIELPLSGPRLVAPPFLFIDTISDLVVFEASRLLRVYPDLNACYIDSRTVAHFEEVNFGISFDADRSLKVLALRHADALSLGAIQSGIEELLHVYESGAIPAELLQSATVTLSDLSRSDGADYMFPLLNVQQSLTLGITRSNASLFRLYASFDHRVSEGLHVSRFLGELRRRVQSHHRRASHTGSEAGGPRCGSCDQTLAAEIRAGGRGLIRIVTAEGEEGLLCRNCFEGWS